MAMDEWEALGDVVGGTVRKSEAVSDTSGGDEWEMLGDVIEQKPKTAPAGTKALKQPDTEADTDKYYTTKVLNGVTYRKNKLNGAIWTDDGKVVIDDDVVKAFGRSKPTKVAIGMKEGQDWLEEQENQGGYASELGKSIASAAIKGVGDTFRGATVQMASDKPTVDAVEASIASLSPASTNTDAEKIFASLRDGVKSGMINPVTALNYESAVRAFWRGDKKASSEYLATARKYATTGPLEENPYYQGGAQMNAAAERRFRPAPGWEKSWTVALGQGLGSTVGFVPLGLATGGVGVAAAGGAQMTAQQLDKGQEELAAVRAGKASPGSKLQGLPSEEQARIVLQQAKIGAVPGMTEDLPIEFLLKQTANRLPGLKTLADTPAFGKLVKATGRVLTQALAEGGQEYAQQVMSNFITQLYLNADQELTEDAWDGFLVGALTGGVMQGAVEGVGAAYKGLQGAPGKTDLPPPSAAQPAPAAPPPPQQAAAAPAKGAAPVPGTAPRAPDDFSQMGVEVSRRKGGVNTAPPAPRSGPTQRVAEVGQPAGDRVLADTKLFGDGADAKAVVSKGFQSLGRDRQHVVLANVVRSLNDEQVLRRIVQAVPVDVMDNLVGGKGSTQLLLRDPTMLAKRLSVPRDVAIPEPVVRFVNSLAPQIGGVATSNTAKKPDLPRVSALSTEGNAAAGARSNGRLDARSAAEGSVGAASHLGRATGEGDAAGGADEVKDRHGEASNANQQRDMNPSPEVAQKEAGATTGEPKPEAQDLQVTEGVKPGSAPMAPRQTEQGGAKPSSVSAKPSSGTIAPNRAGQSDAETQKGGRRVAEGSAPPITRRDVADDEAITTSGRKVPVKYAVVEAADLVPSQNDDGSANPAYPAELQPRDRERGVSAAQIHDIATKLEPRLLDKSAKASDGSPIVAEDGTVESGNGRTLAIRRAYQRGMPGAERYRSYMKEQGYPVDGMTQPVLVRVRQGEMAGEDRQAFTREANERDTLAMSSTERAMADASQMSDGVLALYRGGDVDQAGNREFVKAFLRDVVSKNDQAGMVDANGMMSQDAVRRVAGALLAKAYGDSDLVAAMTESADTNIKGIGGALMDVAGFWAKMRAEAAAGEISPDVDQTEHLLTAVRLVERSRVQGQPLALLVGQKDIFSGTSIGAMPEAFLSLMFDNTTAWKVPIGRDRLAEALRFYVDEARKTTPGVDLLGVAPASPDEILALAKKKQQKGRTDEDAQQGLNLARPPRQDARKAGEDDGSQAKPRNEAAESGEAAGNGGGKEVAASRPPATKALDGEVISPSSIKLEEPPKGFEGLLEESLIEDMASKPRAIVEAWMKDEKVNNSALATLSAIAGPYRVAREEGADAEAQTMLNYANGWVSDQVVDPSKAAPSGDIKKSAYGAKNTLVTADRAAEIRKRLQDKLKNQLGAGIDPEVLAMGAELAAFHIEAGARKFGEFARAVAADLGMSVEQLRPYLRGFYNGARDLMEDNGLDIEGMEGAEEVKAEMARLFGKEPAAKKPTPAPVPAPAAAQPKGDPLDRAGPWREADIVVTLDDGSKEKMNAGYAVDFVKNRIKAVSQLLECVRAA